MTGISRVLLAALLASGTAGIAVAKEKAPAAAPTTLDPKNLSKPGRTAILAAQEQQKAGDQAGALTTLRAAETAGGLNDTDKFYVAQTKLGIGQTLKDNAVIEESLKGSVASPLLGAPERLKFTAILGSLAKDRRDYTAATQYYEQLVALEPGNADNLLGLAIIYRDLKQNQKAVDIFEKAIAASRAKGAKAPESWYQTRLQIAYDGKLAPAVGPASVDLVTDYPTATNWSNVLLIYRDTLPNDDQLTLDVFRLMRALDAVGSERNWQEYASTALEKGLPGEAKKVLDDGVAAKKLTGTKPIEKEILAAANPKITADKASLAGLEKDAAKAPNGKAALGTGDAYFGYGNYPKAVEMYRLAVTKGAGVDAATANLRLGAALALAGDKPGATTALQAVGAGPRQQLAQYWLIHVNGKA